MEIGGTSRGDKKIQTEGPDKVSEHGIDTGKQAQRIHTISILNRFQLRGLKNGKVPDDMTSRRTVDDSC